VHESRISAQTWRKSSYSEAGNCVEVGDKNGQVLVRDTKLATRSGVLSFSMLAWREFIDSVNRSHLSS
jgi:Domain of unknown function (DUF397)